MRELLVRYYDDKPEESGLKGKTIFLAGCSVRNPEDKSWRPEAIALFQKFGFEGTLFAPELRACGFPDNWDYVVEWEDWHLHRADCILFWIQRDFKKWFGFTTNIEWGRWESSGKVVLGSPPGAKKTRYIRYYANKLGIPTSDTIEETVKSAMEMVAGKAVRLAVPRLGGAKLMSLQRPL